VATPVTVPSLGNDVASAVLIRFLVEPGTRVKRGDALYELDTDKVTQEVEAEADGVLLAVTGTPGVDYLVGATIGWIGEPGEQPPATG
jgi:pyruvate dehydrogenase E2 component (dihydrolipoamide acetyltransferase)